MALRISTDLKNYIVNQAIAKQMAGTMGTGGTASITFYSGVQPDSADDATNGTQLCQIVNIGWGGSNGTIGATSGLLALGTAGGYWGTASFSGTTATAAWARMLTYGTGFTGSAATFRIDGEVGTSSTNTFSVNSTIFTSGGLVSLLTAPISI